MIELGTPSKTSNLNDNSITSTRQVVLVHGAMHGSWCWERVIPHLSFDSIAVDLPGRTPYDRGDATLSSWADVVSQAIKSTPNRKLLVAHSMGGLAALASLHQAASYIDNILLISAVVPASGQCYWDLFPRIARKLGRTYQDGILCIAMPKIAARFQLFNGLSPADKRLLLSRLVPEPEIVFETPVEYAIPDGIRVTYVHTQRDRSVMLKDQYRYVKNFPCDVREISIDCGHSSLYACPKIIAGIINDLASS